MYGVRAIGNFYCYIREASGGDWKICISAYWDNRENHCDITDEDIRQNFKFAAT